LHSSGAENGREQKSRTARVPQLDGLRGLAILLVLIWHYAGEPLSVVGPSPVGTALAMVTSLCWSGVDLFFVLSGFLIGGILIDHRESSSLFKAFYIRRICRIFPLYYLWLTLFFVAAWAHWPASCPSANWLFNHPHPFWSYATFTQNVVMATRGSLGASGIGISWSLAIEEQFYLLLPWIIYLTPRRHLPGTLVALILCAPLIRAGLLLSGWRNGGIANFVLMPCRMDTLLLGVLAAWVVREKHLLRTLQENTRSLYPLAGVLGAGMVLLTVFRLPADSILMALFGYCWVGGFYLAVLLLVLVCQGGWVARCCNLAGLRQLGNVSYGVYLIHQIVNGLCHGLLLARLPSVSDLPGMSVTLIALAITLGLARLSQVWFESPLIRFGHTFDYNPRGSLVYAGDLWTDGTQQDFGETDSVQARFLKENA
jgi:peptidoglycan/LPS O-acetylase OafA/YrhL